MALDYRNIYPGQTVDDPGYPQGKARNVIEFGDGKGTPWEEQLVNDLFGLLQSLLDAAGLTPTDLPDEVGASQYFDALRTLAARRAAFRFVLHNPAGAYTDSWRGIAHGLWDTSGSGQHGWLAAGDSAEIQSSQDGIRWGQITPAAAYVGDFNGAALHLGTQTIGVLVGTGAELQTVASMGTSLAVANTPDAAFAGDFYGVRFLGGESASFLLGDFFAVGASGEIQQRKANTTWTRRRTGGDHLFDIAYDGTLEHTAPTYNGTLFVAVGANARILSVADPADTWDVETADGGFSDSIFAIIHTGQNYIFVGDGQEIQSSPDGKNWTHRYGNESGAWITPLTALVYHKGLVIAYGGAGGFDGSQRSQTEMLVSADHGLTWERRLEGIPDPGVSVNVWSAAVDVLSGIDDSSSRIIAVAGGGRILRSVYTERF